MKRAALILLLSVCAGAGGCKKSSTTTSPSTTTTATTVASPTATDTFNGVLAVGDTGVYKFTVGVYGTVNVSVATIGGAGVPSTIETQLGIGTLSDSGCTTTITALAKPGVIGVTANENAGDYCATIHDVGNLFAPASYTMTVAHP